MVSQNRYPLDLTVNAFVLIFSFTLMLLYSWKLALIVAVSLPLYVSIFAAALVSLVVQWNDTTPDGYRPPDAGGAADTSGTVRVPVGASVQAVAAALHAAQTSAREIAAIFASLREVGALGAEVVIR